MADLINRLSQNVPGPFYVDDTCIDCDLCRSNSPAFFARDDETGYSYVYRQPTTPVEFAQAEEARLACPTESIGNDGFSPSNTSVPTAEASTMSSLASVEKPRCRFQQRGFLTTER